MDLDVKQADFDALVPIAMRAYSGTILAAARAYVLSPWLIAGVMWRESNAGLALKPKGPRGVGDIAPREPRLWPRIPAAAWSVDGKMPKPGGWGLGLMQVDWGLHYDWASTHDWGDPAVNIDYGAKLLRDARSYFSASSFGPKDPRPLAGTALDRATMAAYNAGLSRTYNALTQLGDVDKATTGQDYSAWTLDVLRTWGVKL